MIKNTFQVSVTLTLSNQAAEDIGGVIHAIADLLKIAVPPSYEISRSPSPEHRPPAMKRKLYSSGMCTTCFVKNTIVIQLKSVLF